MNTDRDIMMTHNILKQAIHISAHLVLINTEIQRWMLETRMM